MATPLNRIYPAPGYVLVQADEQMRETESGLVLPENANRRNITGTVIAVGDKEVVPGTELAWSPTFLASDEGGTVRLSVKIGMRVIYRRHAGLGLIDDGSETNEPEYLFLKFSDLVAMLPDGTIKKE